MAGITARACTLPSWSARREAPAQEATYIAGSAAAFDAHPRGRILDRGNGSHEPSGRQSSCRGLRGHIEVHHARSCVHRRSRAARGPRWADRSRLPPGAHVVDLAPYPNTLEGVVALSSVDVWAAGWGHLMTPCPRRPALFVRNCQDLWISLSRGLRLRPATLGPLCFLTLTTVAAAGFEAAPVCDRWAHGGSAPGAGP